MYQIINEKQYVDKKMDYKINCRERDALKGLPHLPRLAYLEAIRPYMDYSTGMVGIRRGISYQSLREELYVEAHTGYVNSGSPSKQQLRRALQTLERAGLITIHSTDKKLIVKCELATWDNCDQNKPGTNPTHKPDTKSAYKNNNKTSNCNLNHVEPDTSETTQPGIPPVSGINYIFLCEAFKKFWQLYPVKFSKQKAWEAFETLSPTEDLFNEMLKALEAECIYRKQATTRGHWMPHWKQAANWIAQRCWEDELPSLGLLSGEAVDGSSKNNTSPKSKSGSVLWDYCEDAFIDECEEQTSSNILSISGYKQKQISY